MTDNLIWTGELNTAVVPGSGVSGTVALYDTTLRDGEQTVGVVLNPEAKLEIAHAIDALGVDRIEGGFARVTDDDRKAIRLIAAASLNAEVWGFARAVTADVEALIDLGISATIIEAPVSSGKLSAYGISKDQLLARIDAAIKFARDEGLKVLFFGVDGTRGDFAFLARVYKSAVEAGATEIACVDTLGIASPEAAAHFVASAREWVGDGIAIHWHGHDDFGLGTAAAIAAVRAGAEWVQGTINGMGERAGNTDLIETALALHALYGYSVNIDFSLARTVSELVRRHSGYSMEPWKAVVGENLFVRESGAVASQFHDPPAIEPYSAKLVGAHRGIVLGKKSGLDSIRIKAEEAGVQLDSEQMAAILSSVKLMGVTKRGLVSDDEFRQLLSRAGRVSV